MSFICPFLDYTQYSYYYWNGGSFKMPHFFNFYFLFLLILVYSLIDVLSYTGMDLSIRAHIIIIIIIIIHMILEKV